MGERGAAFQPADGYDGATLDVEPVSAFGVGVDGHFGGVFPNGIDHAAPDVAIAVSVEAVVGGGDAADEAACDGEVFGGVDGVVALRVAIYLAVADGDGAFGLDALVVTAVDRDFASGEQQVAVALDAFGRDVARGQVGAGGGHVDGAAVEGAGAVAADAFAAGAGVGDAEGAAVHDEERVGLDAGGAGVFSVVAVVCGVACNLYGGVAAVNAYEGVGGEAFLHIGGDGDADGAVRHHDIVFAADAMAGRGGDADGGAVDGYIVVGSDARFALGRDGEGAGAAELQFAFAKEGGFLVLVGVLLTEVSLFNLFDILFIFELEIVFKCVLVLFKTLFLLNLSNSLKLLFLLLTIFLFMLNSLFEKSSKDNISEKLKLFFAKEDFLCILLLFNLVEGCCNNLSAKI